MLLRRAGLTASAGLSCSHQLSIVIVTVVRVGLSFVNTHYAQHAMLFNANT